jgi:membrane associated rhomboid family serine protease
VNTRVPWITLLLIAANIIPAFGLFFDPEIAYSFGFRPDVPSVLTALTGMFLHLNVVHLLGNMVFLAAVGPSVESAVGALKFFLIYLVGGLVGVLAHWLLTRRAEDPGLLIGASGAVAACVGYASVRYFGVQVPLTPKVRVPIWSVAAIWVVLQVIGGFVRLGDPQGSVAFWDHLGGFAAGVLFSLIFRATTSVQIEAGHKSLTDMSERSPAAALAAAEQHLRRHPNDLRALREKADAQSSLGDHEHEAETRSLIYELSTGSELGAAARELALCEPKKLSQIATIRRIRDAEALSNTDSEAAATLLQSVVEGPVDDPMRPDAILALATLVQAREPERASGLLAELDARYPLHPVADLARAKGLLR